MCGGDIKLLAMLGVFLKEEGKLLGDLSKLVGETLPEKAFEEEALSG